MPDPGRPSPARPPGASPLAPDDVPIPRADDVAYGGDPAGSDAVPAVDPPPGSRAAGTAPRQAGRAPWLPWAASAAILAAAVAAITARSRGPRTEVPAGPASLVASDRAPEPERTVPPLAVGALDVALSGTGALETAVLSGDWAADRGLRSRGALLRFVVVAEGGAPGAPVRIGIEDGALVLALAPEREAGDDPEADLVRPAALLGPVLRGQRLPVSSASRPAAVVALGLLVGARDGAAAGKALEGVPRDAGVRVLAAIAALLSGNVEATHASLLGLEADPDVGAVARFVTGAAYLEGGNPKEAIRDLDAALAARPGFWPAALVKGAAYESLDLPEPAALAYGAVLALEARQDAARLRLAVLLARTDLAGAARALEALVADRPALAAGWRALGEVRRRGETAEDARGEAEAFRRLATLRPDDATAWDALGGAEARLASRGGGGEAYAAAAEAYSREASLAPEDGLAWFDRGAVLLQAALDPAAASGARAFRDRLQEARACYAKALARGLRKDAAVRAQFNLGILLDYRPPAGGRGDGGGDLPATAAEAFEAALRIDPAFVQAGLALVAARVAAKDGAGAEKALKDLPPGADPSERAALESAVRWLRPEPPAPAPAREGPSASRTAEGDPLAGLARSLIVLGYRRTALALLDGETKDAARLALRARARAFLYDVEGLESDLRLLAAVDPKAASEARERDPVVRAALVP